MNIDLWLCQIKAEIRYKNISFEYFVKCFALLSNLINLEHNQAALAFANSLKNASVIINSLNEQKEYFIYYNNLNDIINNLEQKLQNKVIKVR